MPLYNTIAEYCAAVCAQLRWKKAHSAVTKELTAHFEDQNAAYLAAGDSESDAAQKALAQLGDAVSVGQAFDRTHRPQHQVALLGLALGLFICGAFLNVVLGIISPAGIWVYAIGFCVLLCCYLLDFTWLGRWPLVLYGLGTAFCYALLVFSTSVNGAAVFMTFGWFPLRLCQLVFPLLFGLALYALRGFGLYGVLLAGVAYVPLGAYLLLVPSLSGFFVFTGSALFLLCFAIAQGYFGPKKRVCFAVVLTPTAFCVLFAAMQLLRSTRFRVMLNPAQDPYGSGYFALQVRAMVQNAAMVGRGSAEVSSQIFLNNSYLLTAVLHRFGWVIFAAILCVFALFIGLCAVRCLRQPSVLGKLVALSILLCFTMQFVLYVMANLGIGLMSAIPLPFFAYSRGELWLNAALAGFMLSVFRTGSVQQDNVPRRLELRFDLKIL